MQKFDFTNVDLSKDCNAKYQLNHFKYNMCMYCQEYCQVILGYNFLLFLLVKNSEQISKVPPFLKLGCK